MTYSEKAAANLERYRTEPSQTEGTPNWLKGLGAGSVGRHHWPDRNPPDRCLLPAQAIRRAAEANRTAHPIHHHPRTEMTITTTRLALPITLGDDFPYRKEFFKQLQIFVQNDSTWHGQFLAAWLTPKETLLQMEAVRCDYCSVEEMWECYGEDNFDENPAVEIGKDNHIYGR